MSDRRSETLIVPDSTPSPTPDSTAQQVTPGSAAPWGSVVDRRMWPDRRNTIDPSDESGLNRRRGAGRRLSDFSRRAESGEMTQEQFMFLVAIDEFKKANARQFPSWTDVLEVIRLLGYRKTAASALSLGRAEDWLERPDAPANVRPDGWAGRAA